MVRPREPTARAESGTAGQIARRKTSRWFDRSVKKRWRLLRTVDTKRRNAASRSNWTTTDRRQCDSSGDLHRARLQRPRGTRWCLAAVVIGIDVPAKQLSLCQCMSADENLQRKGSLGVLGHVAQVVGSYQTCVRYSGSMIATADDVTCLMQSASALHPGQTIPVDRDDLRELCEEVLAQRQLLERMGTDLRTVAARGQRPTP